MHRDVGTISFEFESSTFRIANGIWGQRHDLIGSQRVPLILFPSVSEPRVILAQIRRIKRLFLFMSYASREL